MATMVSCGAVDTTIVVLHPTSAPHVTNADGILEFEGEGALILPTQKQLKDSLVRVLNEFVSVRKAGDVAVEFRLRVDPETGTEFPATHVIRLAGSDVTVAEVEAFRVAARIVLSELVPQRTLGDSANEHLLEESEIKELKALGEEVATRFANRSIKQGVMVNFGGGELQGVAVQGVMPALTVEQGAQGVLRGTARPMGFDEHKGIANLWLIPEASDEESSHVHGRTEVLCHNLDFLRILAKAYANRSLVEYEAVSQLEARKRKMVITILALKEVAVDEVDSFELQKSGGGPGNKGNGSIRGQ